MRKFSYTIFDSKSSKRSEGKVEADSVELAVQSLQSEGYTVLHIKEDNPLSLGNINQIQLGGVSEKTKVLFIRQLSTMISAGLPLVQSLELLQDQGKGKFKTILQGVVQSVRGGKSLGDAFSLHKDIFTFSQISLIRAGEGSGKFEEILNKMADDMERSQTMHSKIRGAFIYPIVLLCIAIGVVVMLLIIMIPQMESLYASFNAKLPWETESLVMGSNIVINYWWLIITIIAVVTGFLMYYKNTKGGKHTLDLIFIHTPIFGSLISKSAVANFARIMSMFTQAGIPILDALEMAANSMSNELYASAIRDAAKKVEKGIPLSTPIGENKLFPPILSKMILIGESTGSMTTVLDKLAQYFESEVDTTASNLTKLMEPITLVMMGIIVGYLAVAIYLPIYNLSSVITS